MRTLVFSLLISVLSFGIIANDALAKRFGGGRSFGVQRSHSSLYSAPNTSTNKAFGAQNTTRKWGGVLGGALGGLLAGGLLASLFMGHGVGAGMLSWLIIGVIGFFIFSLLRKKMQSGAQPAKFSAFGAQQANSFNPNTANFNNSQTEDRQSDNNTANYPDGFDSEEFLRTAKLSFFRLQSAYDQKNRQDLSAFTAPEVFAEIEMQLHERGNAPNTTEVLSLDAKLLDVSKQFDSTIASVHFSGSIKENNEAITQLDEIWHFRQFAGNNAWVVGGIQQNN